MRKRSPIPRLTRRFEDEVEEVAVCEQFVFGGGFVTRQIVKKVKETGNRGPRK
jgi:hypothetical protein